MTREEIVRYWLDITNYNIEARYPEDKDALTNMLTPQACRNIINDTKQLQRWIKKGFNLR